MRLTTASKALAVLQQAKYPISVKDVFHSIRTTSSRDTVARALRRYRSKGIVTSKRNGGRFVLWSFKQTQTAKVPLSKLQPKGVARRNIMCRPDNMPTLCTAIDNAVAGFIANKKGFSAYDVTAMLRDPDQAYLPSIDIAETGTVHVDGKDIAKIDHDIVKEAVHDLFQRDGMPGYGRTHSDSHSGGHWVYAEAVVVADDSSNNAGDDDSNDDDAPDDTAPGTSASYDGASTL